MVPTRGVASLPEAELPPELPLRRVGAGILVGSSSSSTTPPLLTVTLVAPLCVARSASSASGDLVREASPACTSSLDRHSGTESRRTVSRLTRRACFLEVECAADSSRILSGVVASEPSASRLRADVLKAFMLGVSPSTASGEGGGCDSRLWSTECRRCRCFRCLPAPHRSTKRSQPCETATSAGRARAVGKVRLSMSPDAKTNTR